MERASQGFEEKSQFYIFVSISALSMKSTKLNLLFMAKLCIAKREFNGEDLDLAINSVLVFFHFHFPASHPHQTKTTKRTTKTSIIMFRVKNDLSFMPSATVRRNFLFFFSFQRIISFSFNIDFRSVDYR
jgi:hypothetical protein